MIYFSYMREILVGFGFHLAITLRRSCFVKKRYAKRTSTMPTAALLLIDWLRIGLHVYDVV